MHVWCTLFFLPPMLFTSVRFLSRMFTVEQISLIWSTLGVNTNIVRSHIYYINLITEDNLIVYLKLEGN